MRKVLIVVLALILYSEQRVFSWGFTPHRKINRWAMVLLPPPLLGFFKTHIQFVEKHATDPDSRRYIDTSEAAKHYIDLERFPVSDALELPHQYRTAVDTFGKKLLQKEGQLPWNIYWQVHRLKTAFQNEEIEPILRSTAELGHYVADAHVPLHTTANYNGQLTGQHGIHGLWETSLPQLFMDTLLIEQKETRYITNLMEEILEVIHDCHALVPTVLYEEKQTQKVVPEHLQWAYTQTNKNTQKTHSYLFRKQYLKRLDGMVQQRMGMAVLFLRDCIYTAWIMAGQPNLPDTKASLEKANDLKIQELECQH